MAVVASTFVHGEASASPGTGGIVAALPVATTTARRADEHVVPDHDPALAVESPVAANERDAALLEPRQLGRVVEVVDDLVATCEHGPDVELSHGDSRHPPRLGGQLPGRSSAFDGMQA